MGARYIPRGYGFNVGADFARAPHDLLLRDAQHDASAKGYRGTVAPWDNATLSAVRIAWRARGAVSVFVQESCTKRVLP